jgi:hypothetical protein
MKTAHGLNPTAEIEAATVDPGTGRGRVVVQVQGQEYELFQYYSDEVRFTADEFIGLTVDDGYRLFLRRDLAYLRT